MAAEAALNKSLDDLIAEQRTKKDTVKAKKEIRKGNRPAGDRAPLSTERRSRGGGGAGGAPRAGQAPRQLSITVRGGVSKPRRASGGGVREEREREDPERREAALEGGAKWGHDQYRGPPPARGPRGGPRSIRDPSELGTKLFISNLHFNVIDGDIKELFETCGPLVKHMVHYDNSGRSEGTAEVVYENAAHAEKAMRQYNNVQLDGNAMQIELIPQAAARAAGGGPRTLSSGIRISGERGGGPRMVQLTRHFQQAAGGSAPLVVRGRGSVRNVRSGVAAMQE
ncbi:THO complex subunit 4A [Chlorella vulgaris]